MTVAAPPRRRPRRQGRVGKAFMTLAHFVRHKPLGVVGALLVLVLGLGAALGPYVVPFDPVEIDKRIAYSSPSTTHPLGTDFMGRDILSRVLNGGRISLTIGFSAAFLGSTVGALFGLFSAYFKGGFDALGQRLIDALMSIPSLVMAMALAVFFTRSMVGIIIAIAIPMMPRAARVVRSSALSISEMQYVDAARATGCSTLRIVLVHLAPNCVAPYLVVLTALIATAIVTESSLGFLGIGIPPPAATWGQMLSRSQMSMLHAPWEAVFPGVAISLAVLGFNLFGDALRDVLDPRLRGR